MKKRLILLGSIASAAMASTTPNMLLNKPAINQPNYATKINTIFDQIDSHDHSPGKGVSITSDGLEDGAVSENKIATNAVSSNKIAANSVTSVKIGDGAVTNAKISVGSITGAVFGDGGIATSKLADGAVTPAKRSALGQQVSIGTAGTFTTSTSYQAMPGMTTSITTTGRPIKLGIQSDGSVNDALLTAVGGALGSVQLERDGVRIAGYQVYPSATQAIQFLDSNAAAGAHVYRVVGRLLTGGSTLYHQYLVLTAYEE